MADYRRRLAQSGENLGLVLKYLKRNQEAEEAFRKAIEDHRAARARRVRPARRPKEALLAARAAGLIAQ